MSKLAEGGEILRTDYHTIFKRLIIGKIERMGLWFNTGWVSRYENGCGLADSRIM
ncbi:predicted protein [Sclerotinia sclerotiorum 1980 UF-70]|uniref:Uncharacterized protein n=1 Tax=Sclerotinia sclerotiorum (strain ATCC 18683 / 1980 / Ss-1) TaxID=665079 RepID=A7EBY9_SCLS1|nr:predicted protein [Sclerotinia sclerotiorum 1980 UF-70]EDN99967.1 predicted protein [Sclerotinia sclerotiorum 1980 UF-70]